MLRDALAAHYADERFIQVMPLADYLSHFKNQVRSDPKAVFHHADIYAPHYGTVRSVTWVETDAAATTQGRLQAVAVATADLVGKRCCTDIDEFVAGGNDRDTRRLRNEASSRSCTGPA